MRNRCAPAAIPPGFGLHWQGWPQGACAARGRRYNGFGRAGLAITGVMVASLLAGCAGSAIQLPGLKSNLTAAAPAAETASAEPARSASQAPSFAVLAKAHSAGPKDPNKALAYARRLKAKGQLDAAAKVLDAAGGGKSGDKAVVMDRGLIALELGEASEAKSVLSQIGPATTENWQALSGLGIAEASRGHQKEAQRYFRQALQVSPDNTAVLNNLAFSYILDRKVDEAEKLLKKASKSGVPHQVIARNLQLVAALRTDIGKP